MTYEEILIKAAEDVVREIVLEEYKTSTKYFTRTVYFARSPLPFTQEQISDMPCNFYSVLKKVLEDNDYTLVKYRYSKETPVTFDCKTKY